MDLKRSSITTFGKLVHKWGTCTLGRVTKSLTSFLKVNFKTPTSSSLGYVTGEDCHPNDNISSIAQDTCYHWMRKKKNWANQKKTNATKRTGARLSNPKEKKLRTASKKLCLAKARKIYESNKFPSRLVRRYSLPTFGYFFHRGRKTTHVYCIFARGKAEIFFWNIHFDWLWIILKL